jgi:hypothetical protein
MVLLLLKLFFFVLMFFMLSFLFRLAVHFNSFIQSCFSGGFHHFSICFPFSRVSYISVSREGSIFLSWPRKDNSRESDFVDLEWQKEIKIYRILAIRALGGVHLACFSMIFFTGC